MNVKAMSQKNLNEIPFADHCNLHVTQYCTHVHTQASHGSFFHLYLCICHL